jgi:hypothetical protein
MFKDNLNTFQIPSGKKIVLENKKYLMLKLIHESGDTGLSLKELNNHKSISTTEKNLLCRISKMNHQLLTLGLKITKINRFPNSKYVLKPIE